MIKIVLTDNIKYTGYMVGEEPIKTATFNKKVFIFGIKVFEHTYNCNEVLEEVKEVGKKGIGFKESNK